MPPPDEKKPEQRANMGPHVRAVRLGHGANCSSIGSVIDTLFVSVLVVGAVYVAISAALGAEKVTVVGEKKKTTERDETST